jgi:quercetin dioxygenase-like cupin family protein
MNQAKEFNNLDDTSDGLFRELGPGVTTRIFSGEQAMLSVVSMAPNAQGTLHHHPEEHWGVLLEGSAVRVQDGEEIPVKKGDFWRTPSNVQHTMRAGPEGARVPTCLALHDLSTGRRARDLQARSTSPEG